MKIIMDKKFYILKFRNCNNLDTLEKVYRRMEEKNASNPDIFNITSAYDHRKAELVMGKLYDKIPPSVWKYVD